MMVDNIDNSNELPLNISIIISERDGHPCIELRRVIKNIDVMKTVISCAVHNRPIVLMPKFFDRIKSISTLLDKGIIYKGADGGYYFTI